MGGGLISFSLKKKDFHSQVLSPTKLNNQALKSFFRQNILYVANSGEENSS